MSGLSSEGEEGEQRRARGYWGSAGNAVRVREFTYIYVFSISAFRLR